MSLGKGKYDSQLGDALKSAGAKQGILIVIDGKDGPSFVCRLDSRYIVKISLVLREIAGQIEEQTKNEEFK